MIALGHKETDAKMYARGKDDDIPLDIEGDFFLIYNKLISFCSYFFESDHGLPNFVKLFTKKLKVNRIFGHMPSTLKVITQSQNSKLKSYNRYVHR